jgi:hypothetical protein
VNPGMRNPLFAYSFQTRGRTGLVFHHDLFFTWLSP